MAPHPLDPLSPNEIGQVVKLTKQLKNLSSRAKFMSLGTYVAFWDFIIIIFYVLSFCYNFVQV